MLHTLRPGQPLPICHLPEAQNEGTGAKPDRSAVSALAVGG